MSVPTGGAGTSPTALRRARLAPCESAPPCSRSSGSRLPSRRSTSPSRRRARCSSGSPRAASATPTSTPPPAPTRRGYAPCVLGHEGAGVVERVGEGVTLVAPGDHVITLFAPECGRCVHCLSDRTNRCVAIREQQGLGYLPDGTARFSRGGEPLRHFMGTSTFAEYTVMPEIALAKVSPEASARGLRPVCLRPLDRDRRRPLHGAVEPGSTCVVFGCGLVGLGAVIGCRLRRSGANRGRRPLRGTARPGAPPRRHGHARSPATTRSTGSARRPAASGPTTPSRRPVSSR